MKNLSSKGSESQDPSIPESLEDSLDSWVLRTMIRHRRLGIEELAQRVGRSKTWVYDTLRGRPRGRVTMEGVRRNRDRLEAAITEITEERGGIPNVCCSEEELLNLTSFLVDTFEYRVGGLS